MQLQFPPPSPSRQAMCYVEPHYRCDNINIVTQTSHNVQTLILQLFSINNKLTDFHLTIRVSLSRVNDQTYNKSVNSLQDLVQFCYVINLKHSLCSQNIFFCKFSGGLSKYFLPLRLDKLVNHAPSPPPLYCLDKNRRICILSCIKILSFLSVRYLSGLSLHQG